MSNEVISIHDSDISEFDCVDVGEISESARIVPLLVKSLLFPAVGPEPREVLA